MLCLKFLLLPPVLVVCADASTVPKTFVVAFTSVIIPEVPGWQDEFRVLLPPIFFCWCYGVCNIFLGFSVVTVYTTRGQSHGFAPVQLFKVYPWQACVPPGVQSWPMPGVCK